MIKNIIILIVFIIIYPILFCIADYQEYKEKINKKTP